jgi:glucose-6-phosphate 1-epimerase
VSALGPTPSITAKYDRPFHLAYVVTLAEHQLSTDLHVENTSTSSTYPPSPLEFQALFHNYIAALANDVLVFPLTGKSYLDKTDSSLEGKNALKTESRAGVDVKKFTDSVYEDAGGRYEVNWPGGGVEIKTNLKDLVVWNPQETGAKMGDMQEGGWYVVGLRCAARNIDESDSIG